MVHRYQVLEAIANWLAEQSLWLHWTLDAMVAVKYRKHGRKRYGDTRNYVIRIGLRDPRTLQALGTSPVRMGGGGRGARERCLMACSGGGDVVEC